MWQLLNYWQTKSKLASIFKGGLHWASGVQKHTAAPLKLSALPELNSRVSTEKQCLRKLRQQCGREYVLLHSLIMIEWSQAWTLITAYTLAVCDCVLKQLRTQKGRLRQYSTVQFGKHQSLQKVDLLKKKLKKGEF